MGPFGFWEIALIFAIVLLIFGAGKLPGLGKALGQTFTNFRRGVRSLHKDGDKKSSKKDDSGHTS